MEELNKKNFEEEVLESDKVVLVDFWSPSCDPCKDLIPHVEKLEKEYSGSIKFTSLDITKARRLAIRQKILSIPEVAIYKEGEKIGSVIGEEATAESVEELIKKYA